jgi:hypothetical protein
MDPQRLSQSQPHPPGVMNTAFDGGNASNQPVPTGQPSWGSQSPGNAQHGYPGAVGGQPGYLPPTSTSTPAIISLLFGMFSPFLILFCFVSIISSAVAIICGHVALASIRRPENRLTGKGLAIAGLVLGYLTMIASIALLVFFLTRPERPRSTDGPNLRSPTGPSDALSMAESNVSSASDGVGTGNSPEATQLASSFAEQMKEVSDKAFTKGRKRLFQLSGGNFVTHCHLDSDSCVFIVHVPQYRDYADDAKSFLAEIAWQVALNAVGDQLPANGKLAVALRGTIMYGDIQAGSKPTDEGAEWPVQPIERSDLLPFFELEKVPVSPTNTASPDSSPTDSNAADSEPLQTQSKTED